MGRTDPESLIGIADYLIYEASLFVFVGIHRRAGEKVRLSQSDRRDNLFTAAPCMTVDEHDTVGGLVNGE
jgi:hypothetical protein